MGNVPFDEIEDRIQCFAGCGPSRFEVDCPLARRTDMSKTKHGVQFVKGRRGGSKTPDLTRCASSRRASHAEEAV